jgi:iron complex transport system permease protein
MATAPPPPRVGLHPARQPGGPAVSAGAPAASRRPARARSGISFRLLLTVMVVLTPAVLLLGIGIGAVGIPLNETAGIVAAHLAGRHSGAPPVDQQIIWEVRAPRVLLAFVVGASLAVAGAVLQAVVRNPLADPYVLGVSSGASAAAVAVLTLATSGAGWLARLGVSGAAFAGAMATIGVVVLLGQAQVRAAPQRLLLAGVAVSYLLQGVTSYLQLRATPDQLAGVLFWLLGSVSAADWSQLRLPALILACCIMWLLVQGRRINALLLGDDAATALGIRLARFRLMLLLVAALLTAVVIAVAGGVGFVGLIAPHSVRLLSGSDHRRLLPATALLGGIFLTLADLAGRAIAAPLEMPLSIVTAVAGVPFFLVLLRRSS